MATLRCAPSPFYPPDIAILFFFSSPRSLRKPLSGSVRVQYTIPGVFHAFLESATGEMGPRMNPIKVHDSPAKRSSMYF